MWSLKNVSIPWKLKTVILCTTTVALIVTCAALFTFERVAFQASLEQNLSTLAQVIGDNCSASVVFGQADKAKELLSALEAEVQIEAACIYEETGEVFESYERPGTTQRTPALRPADGFHWEEQYLLFVGPLIDKKTNQRAGTICLLANFSAMRQRFRLYAQVIGGVLLVSFVVAYLLSGPLQRIISKPILDLARTARSISVQKDYSVRAEKQGNDEIGAFTDAFNLMLTQIEQQDQALRLAKEGLEERVADRTRELRELQRQNELILNSAGEGIYGLDLAGRMTFVNPTAAQMIGSTVEELVGQDEHSVVRHSNSEGVPHLQEGCPICADFKLGHPYTSADEILRRKSGATFHATYIRTPLVAEGQLVGAVVVFRDISERLQLENQLRQAQKMEAVGKLSAGIAHDFNNILTIIQGYTSMALTAGPSSLYVRETLSEVLTASERAATLIRQLLAFSRKQIMQPKVVDLNQLIQHFVNMLGRLIGENIRLKVSYAANLPPIWADAVNLEQVIMNLVVNARDAMPEYGQLVISTGVLEIDEHNAQQHLEASPGRFVWFSVADSGCGIDPSIQEHLFEPFFTTKDVGKGTGMGLAMVYGTVKQHKGWIEVTSRKDQGSTFKVFLPATQTATRELPDEALDPTGSLEGNETILVVEDEKGILELVRRVLQERGYNILTAQNSTEAIDIWKQHSEKIDMLLTDVVMPGGMSGRTLGEQLSAEKPGLKVIYSSGYSLQVLGTGLNLEDGLNFLPKPYQPQRLIETVRSAFDAT
jgi:PAS domain S-box-containing protein